ncbi:xylose isomerase [Lasius niger]|uniref:Xylose isomerase n=1 Tax=Lasius niger TaxID=67767 RepID=A0A0J7MNG2_LASNI|nr:xylose isomerase [Lasius niger]
MDPTSEDCVIDIGLRSTEDLFVRLLLGSGGKLWHHEIIEDPRMTIDSFQDKYPYVLYTGKIDRFRFLDFVSFVNTLKRCTLSVWYRGRGESIKVDLIVPKYVQFDPNELLSGLDKLDREIENRIPRPPKTSVFDSLMDRYRSSKIWYYGKLSTDEDYERFESVIESIGDAKGVHIYRRERDDHQKVLLELHTDYQGGHLAHFTRIETRERLARIILFEITPEG